ncbi:hypothetical protein GCM10010340_11140 [Streptomyces griseoloalbus]|nr:hypothetical protein GCM10010340_11140 [Streptomyces albaduncus]
MLRSRERAGGGGALARVRVRAGGGGALARVRVQAGGGGALASAGVQAGGGGALAPARVQVGAVRREGGGSYAYGGKRARVARKRRRVCAAHVSGPRSALQEGRCDRPEADVLLLASAMAVGVTSASGRASE